MDICEYFFYKPSSLYIYMYIIVKCKYHKITIYLQQINKIYFFAFVTKFLVARFCLG